MNKQDMRTRSLYPICTDGHLNLSEESRKLDNDRREKKNLKREENEVDKALELGRNGSV